MTVRVGVIGVGLMGAEHARLLSRTVTGAEVTGVFDVDPDRASVTADLVGVQTYADPVALINEPQVDAVLIASVDATHEEYVLACLAAGKPVLCEKPLAPGVEGCRRILEAEIGLGRRLVTVGFMRRFDPGYEALRSDLAGLGPPLLVRCVHRNVGARPGQPSSNLISGSAVHEFDAARWLLGEDPVRITVHRPRASSHAGGTRDPLLIVVEMASGTLIDIDIFVNARYGYDVRCEVVAEEGSALLDSPHPVVRRTAASAARAVPVDWRHRFAEAYRRELQEWVDGVALGQARGASSWDGYVATATATAGIRALDTGRTIDVELPTVPELYR